MEPCARISPRSGVWHWLLASDGTPLTADTTTIAANPVDAPPSATVSALFQEPNPSATVSLTTYQAPEPNPPADDISSAGISSMELAPLTSSADSIPLAAISESNRYTDDVTEATPMNDVADAIPSAVISSATTTGEGSTANEGNGEELWRPRWNWVLAPDGSPFVAEWAIETKQETSSITGNEKWTRWNWVLSPDGSPSIAEWAVEMTNDNACESTKRKHPTRQQNIEEIDSNDVVGKRKKSKKDGAWFWLLAPDGSPSTSENRNEEASIAYSPNTRHYRETSTSDVDCAEASDDDTDSSEESDDCDEWSYSAEPYGDSSSEKNKDEDEDEDALVSQVSEKSDDTSKYRKCEILRWEANFKLLIEYKKKHGTTRVPYSDQTLGRWVDTQRYTRMSISRYRRQRLNSIGFEWKITFSWEKMYNQLCVYKRQNNGCTRVRGSFGPLRGWVYWQRVQYKRNELSQKRINLLDSIGFKWKIQKSWMTMYKRYVVYTKKHNKNRIRDDQKLSRWVNKQRQECTAKDRIKLLNAVGFQWNPLGARWTEMYQRLVAYNAKHGTTCVPKNIDAQLASWVSYQRFRRNDQHRIDLLNNIGFVWRWTK